VLEIGESVMLSALVHIACFHIAATAAAEASAEAFPPYQLAPVAANFDPYLFAEAPAAANFAPFHFAEAAAAAFFAPFHFAEATAAANFATFDFAEAAAAKFATFHFAEAAAAVIMDYLMALRSRLSISKGLGHFEIPLGFAVGM
jgi:hypothetical protein